MSDDWLNVMDVAHRLGLNSSATMMFGHVETLEDRIEHLERIRAQQDKSAQRAAGIVPAESSASRGFGNGLSAGETRRMAVTFVLDASLPAEVNTLTLSYTFFEIAGKS